MNATEYNSILEEFMANNHGSTAFHTFCCIMYSVQCSLFSSVSELGRSATPWRYLFEFFIIVLPLIAVHTFLSSYLVTILNICMIYTLYYEIDTYCDGTKLVQKFAQDNAFNNGRSQTLSVVRGLTFLLIMLSVMAVDFKNFPRKLAETENYWYSLMDTVIGLFVLTSGLVHNQDIRKGFVATLKSNAKFVSVLLCLAVSRYLSVKRLHYRELVEYGVNWHFFFTIVLCKLLSSLVLYYSNRRLLLCIISIAIQEFLLYWGLEEWVFRLVKWVFIDTPRTDLILANRDGISSVLGYVSIYLFAAHYQSLILDRSLERSKVQEYLAGSVALLWLLTYAVPVYRLTSRTLANAGYCLYVEAIVLTIIMVTYFFEVVYDDFEAPLILSAVNKNI